MTRLEIIAEGEKPNVLELLFRRPGSLVQRRLIVARANPYEAWAAIAHELTRQYGHAHWRVLGGRVTKQEGEITH